MGIGRAVAVLFAAEGANVIVGDINPDAGKRTIQEIKDFGGKAVFSQVDAANWDDVQRLVQTTESEFGPPNILYSSIAIYTRDKTADIELDTWDNMMAVNVKSSFMLCKAVIPKMQALGGGSIILTSSSVGWHDAAPNIAAYATSKFAITGLTKAAACDYLNENIRVNCICPGPTDTPMIRGGRSAEELENFIDSIPIKRLAKPEEIAKAVLFLASDDSDFITGVAFPVDGGQTAWV